MCEQYDNAILAALPDFIGQFGKENLPKEIFDIKPILKQCVTDEIQKNPHSAFETMIFDKKYLDTKYKTREIDSFLTNYTFEDSLLKPAARSNDDTFQVIVNTIALETVIQQKELGEDLDGEDQIINSKKLTTVNRANKPIYIFIHPDTVKEYEDLLLACMKEPKSASVNPSDYLKMLLKIIEGFEGAIEEKIYQIKMLLSFFNQKIKNDVNTNQLAQIKNEPLLPVLPGKKTSKGQTVKQVNTLVKLLNKKRQEKDEYNTYLKEDVEKNHTFVLTKYNNSQDFLKTLLEIPLKQSLEHFSDATNHLYMLEADENLIKERAIALDLQLEYIANIRLTTYLENAKTVTFTSEPKMPYINMLLQMPNDITYDEGLRTHKACDFSFVATSFETFLSLLEIKMFSIPELKC